FITVSPSVSYNERWYFKTTEYSWDNENRTVDTLTNEGFKAERDYSVSVGMLTRIYGMFQYRKGPVAAIRHVMTPSIAFSYRPDFSEARFGDTNWKRVMRKVMA
ncbi:MAG: putative LPS assembly protein LptD, partial [Bacteroidota bacterium]